MSTSERDNARAEGGSVFAGILGFLLILLVGPGGVPAEAGASPSVYVFNIGSKDISVIDPSTQAVVRTIPLGTGVQWFSDRHFDGTYIWATEANMERAVILLLDPTTMRVAKRFDVGKGPDFAVKITPDLKEAWTHASGDNVVVVIDVKTHQVIRRIPVGEFPCDLDMSPDGGVIWEPDRDADTVRALDRGTGAVKALLRSPQGSKPHMLTVSPDGTTVWVQEREGYSLAVIDARRFQLLERIPVGTRPATNEFTPDGRLTFVTHIGDEIVTVLDVGTRKKLADIRTGRGPVNTVFTPDGRYAYVTNHGSDTVSVIDVARLRVVRTIPVGKMPFGILIR
ncbi:MAG: cytochrome D1 domain-containing protein [Candidatus Methylomirabilia bacterium]